MWASTTWADQNSTRCNALCAVFPVRSRRQTRAYHSSRPEAIADPATARFRNRNTILPYVYACRRSPLPAFTLPYHRACPRSYLQALGFLLRYLFPTHYA
jgi:hypothetical protein